LYSYLASNDFVVEKPIADLIEKVLQSRRKAFLLRGPAGVGKTMLATLIAQYLQAKLVFFQCTYGTSEDDLLYRYIPSEETKSGIRITLGPIPLALKISQGRKVVLLLDEFDKTRPSADALLLDVLQNFRIALYIEDKETIVHGNPENLAIFLTSNDMREFSEPLIRRICMITLKPLPPERIFELLSKKFRKETALLLTQVYADTINANLRKPATIQELCQLGEMIESGMQTSLDDLLRMFVVKYDDDWRRFSEYVARRKAYEILSNVNSNREKLEKYYEPENVEVRIEKRSEEKRGDMQLLLERLKKLTVKTIDENAQPIKIDSDETIEVTLKIPDKDLDAYTAVIKTLKPKPTDDPRRFGKFEYVEDEIKAMISREPLTLEEAYSIVDKTELDVEAYYETTLITGYGLETLDDLFDKASKVKYYSKNKVFLEYEKDDVIEKVVLEKENSITVKVRGYAKRQNMEEAVLLKALRKYQEEFKTVKNLFRVLRLCNIDVSIDASRFEDGSACTDDISAYEVATILKNAQRIRNANIFINIDGGYNIRLEKDKDVITVYIGYVLKNRLKEHGFAGKYSVDSDEVRRIIKVLSGE